MSTDIPRYSLWSTDQIDTSDPFQRRWLLRQTLLHGRAQDIRRLEFDEVGRELDALDLPPHIEGLWRTTYANAMNEQKLLTGKSLLTPLQETFLASFAEIPDQEQ